MAMHAFLHLIAMVLSHIFRRTYAWIHLHMLYAIMHPWFYLGNNKCDIQPATKLKFGHGQYTQYFGLKNKKSAE